MLDMWDLLPLQQSPSESGKKERHTYTKVQGNIHQPTSPSASQGNSLESWFDMNE